MKFVKVKGWSKSGDIEFTEILLPSIRVVCPRCDGNGTHVNPNADDGLTAKDFEDKDFEQSYMSGVYDVQCDCCSGNKVIDVIDEEACKTKLSWYKGLKRYQNAVELEDEARREEYYERRSGC